MGVCNLALLNNQRLPDGICLSYPALNLSKNHFSPSFLQTLNCMITPYSILDLCSKAYQKNCKHGGDVDPLLSPILTPGSWLKLMPPIRICLGENDCLKDDCLRFF